MTVSAPPALRRVNVGCGDFPLADWINIDSAEDSAANLVMPVPPLPFEDNSTAEIYAGHFLEHLEKPTADEFLRECYRVLKPGGRLGILVPDTDEIMRRYLAKTGDRVEIPQGRYWRMDDLDDVCGIFLFSTAQPSHHRWAYSRMTLRRAMEAAGFRSLRPIPYDDPRIPVPAWWQQGFDGTKPGGQDAR